MIEKVYTMEQCNKSTRFLAGLIDKDFGLTPICTASIAYSILLDKGKVKVTQNDNGEIYVSF